jgi:hypothetical protein
MFEPDDTVIKPGKVWDESLLSDQRQHDTIWFHRDGDFSGQADQLM